MKFGFDASAPVSPAGAVATYGSPAFYQGRPERDDINVLGVLHHEDLGDRVRIDVRYAFTGSVSAAVRAVIDPTKMSWVTQTVLYPGELRSSWEILPDHYPDRLSSAGSHRFTPGGDDGTVRHDGGDAVVAGPQRRPRVLIALIRPERDCPFDEGRDRERRVHARISRHHTAVHDMEAGLAEHAQVWVDSAGLTALANRNPADEMGGGVAIDDLSRERRLVGSELLRHTVDEVLDRRDVHRRRRSGRLAAEQAVVPVQLDRGVGRLGAERNEGPLRPVARVGGQDLLARVLQDLLEPGLERMLLLAVLVVGPEEREDVASEPPIGRLDARHRIRPRARGDRDRPR